ncbi:hypothetical protein [Enterococcus sp. BWR-S5]|uniref:hypothetical protein n=1 Tax=Enterococcus sp. BWR-S5 TaxID=2787714 RepID=UPI0019226346|nr:hypothetical protein [Enterococcus sp. BWR-S5]MBL1226602.1 hypothetical protein [Enterococcus sp. BWR-S5]
MGKEESQALTLLKMNLGISKENRDSYLSAIIEGVKTEMKDKGVTLSDENSDHLMFLVDFAAWRYRSRGEGILPRNLQFRKHNLIIKYGGVSNE